MNDKRFSISRLNTPDNALVHLTGLIKDLVHLLQTEPQSFPRPRLENAMDHGKNFALTDG